FLKLVPVALTDGRMPENKYEIILPNHLSEDGGVNYALGDVISLDLGRRTYQGEQLGQHNPCIFDYDSEDEICEELEDIEHRTYTVVGLFENMYYEDFFSPGYTAFTVSDNNPDKSYIGYIRLNDISDVQDYLDNHFAGMNTDTNNDLLRFSGHALEDSFNTMLYSMGGILIAIIVLGSISLIYNSFAISVSERTKQFGLLSSVGATKKQLLRSVLFEAFSLCFFGIPLGLLAGFVGMTVTFNSIAGVFSRFIPETYDMLGLELSFSLSKGAVVSAVIIGMVTVFISALIPAVRAVKINAIDAIRQSGDIKIKPGKVKTSRLTYKLFGFEGMIASKNFKRNKKKYRATVISLFLSVVLFITACSFVSYLKKGTDDVFTMTQYDIAVNTNAQFLESDVENAFNKLSRAKSVTEGTYCCLNYTDISINADNLDPVFLDEVIKNSTGLFGSGCEIIDGKYEFPGVSVYYIEDAYFRDFLKKNGLDEQEYLSADSPKAIALASLALPGSDGRYHTYNTLSAGKGGIKVETVCIRPEIDGLKYYDYSYDEDGNKSYVYTDLQKNWYHYSEQEATYTAELTVGTVVDSAPLCVDDYHSGLVILYPFSAYDTINNFDGNYLNSNFLMTFTSSNHKESSEDMLDIISRDSMNMNMDLYDVADEIETEKELITVINVFSYGFIILISLISAANVFNTISTNISLRRREFAMLKSIGMTRRGFNKMMNYECLLYGLKGLMFGLPVSILLTYLIFESLNFGIAVSFFIPWYAIVIAVGSVFAVVFATMLYAMRKIKKDNPIDALKNENL
ncbi:MAG: ABC transporter permease, partial [Firmicutes bacterium]|nr:ABC transporter permease [Bacillota bacterium]